MGSLSIVLLALVVLLVLGMGGTSLWAAYMWLKGDPEVHSSKEDSSRLALRLRSWGLDLPAKLLEDFSKDREQNTLLRLRDIMDDLQDDSAFVARVIMPIWERSAHILEKDVYRIPIKIALRKAGWDLTRVSAAVDRVADVIDGLDQEDENAKK